MCPEMSIWMKQGANDYLTGKDQGMKCDRFLIELANIWNVSEKDRK